MNATAITNEMIEAPAPRKSGAGADRAFEWITAGAAWFVLLLLAGIAL